MICSLFVFVTVRVLSLPSLVIVLKDIVDFICRRLFLILYPFLYSLVLGGSLPFYLTETPCRLPPESSASEVSSISFLVSFGTNFLISLLLLQSSSFLLVVSPSLSKKFCIF